MSKIKSKASRKASKTKIVIDDQVESVNVIPIEYSKYNPKLPFEINNKLWNVIKYGIAISLMIFCVLGLYFSTSWQAQSNGLNPATGTLVQIKMIGVEKVGASGTWAFSAAFTELFKGNTGRLDELAALNLVADGVKTQSLFDLVPSFTNGMLTTVIVFSILGIITIIPLLVFKNRTAFSLSFIIISIMFLAVTIAMFAMGMEAQNTLLNPYRDVSDTISKLTALHDSKNPDYANEILRLEQHLTDAMNRLSSLFA